MNVLKMLCCHVLPADMVPTLLWTEKIVECSADVETLDYSMEYYKSILLGSRLSKGGNYPDGIILHQILLTDSQPLLPIICSYFLLNDIGKS